MLKGKNAVIYGVSDSLGGAVAKAFAEQGATVYVTNHRIEPAEKIAKEIKAAGGVAIVAQVDALDHKAVNDHLAELTSKGNTVDISFNLIDNKSTQNIPLAEMELEDFIRPIDISMRTQFITNTAAARIMIKQGSGVILSLTATPAGIGYPMVGGFGPACCAMESLTRDLGSELGPFGVRVVTIRSGGSLDSKPFKEAAGSGNPEVPGFFQKMKDDTMLKDLPMMKDIANTAVFLASDMGKMITGVVVDVTAGSTAALNYKAPNVAFTNQQY
ncbi:MAG: SDR family oxidoreductase [Chitinophagaceae bacterium]|nr:MAG: SDR family oxidoreductase [Chitinophagaceae bacterium]